MNGEDGRLAPEKMRAIVQACDEILSGKFRDQFITDAIQGGRGHFRQHERQRGHRQPGH